MRWCGGRPPGTGSRRQGVSGGRGGEGQAAGLPAQGVRAGVAAQVLGAGPAGAPHLAPRDTSITRPPPSLPCPSPGALSSPTFPELLGASLGLHLGAGSSQKATRRPAPGTPFAFSSHVDTGRHPGGRARGRGAQALGQAARHTPRPDPPNVAVKPRRCAELPSGTGDGPCQPVTRKDGRNPRQPSRHWCVTPFSLWRPGVWNGRWCPRGGRRESLQSGSSSDPEDSGHRERTPPPSRWAFLSSASSRPCCSHAAPARGCQVGTGACRSPLRTQTSPSAAGPSPLGCTAVRPQVGCPPPAGGPPCLGPSCPLPAQSIRRKPSLSICLASPVPLATPARPGACVPSSVWLTRGDHSHPHPSYSSWGKAPFRLPRDTESWLPAEPTRPAPCRDVPTFPAGSVSSHLAQAPRLRPLVLQEWEPGCLAG